MSLTAAWQNLVLDVDDSEYDKRQRFDNGKTASDMHTFERLGTERKAGVQQARSAMRLEKGNARQAIPRCFERA